MKILIIAIVMLLALFIPATYAQYGYNESDSEYLGEYSNNPYDSGSVSNPYGQYGSPNSSKSATNPYTTDAPKLYSQDGQYLGKVSSNPYDPESISNPYGKYGSPYSPNSVNNPYGKYGSPYSSQSANNPYTTNAPVIIYEDE